MGVFINCNSFLNSSLILFFISTFSLFIYSSSRINFFSSIEYLSSQLPGLMAVEMEGAAVAQVASQENIPWLIIRVVSDQADELAPQSFTDFLKDYEQYSWFLIKIILQNINKAPIANINKI